MKWYKLQQLIEIIKIFLKMVKIWKRQFVKFEQFFGRLETPCWTAIQKLVENFELLEQVDDVRNKTTQEQTITLLL